VGELNEKRWGVLSERGCEATSLTYAEARDLMRRLLRERVSGLSIITKDAARRAARTENPRRQNQPNGTRPKRSEK
jgi:hypothetical protein